MTDEELAVWLRSLKGLGWSSEAADRIEGLRKNSELQATLLGEAYTQIEELVKERDEAEQRGYANAMEAERKLHEDRIEELEAKLAKAVEALLKDS